MSDEKFEAYWNDRCEKQRPYSTVNLKTVAEEAWQASRAALKVELPDKAQFVEYYEDLEGGTFNWQRYMVAIQEALQQAGIEVVK